MTIHPTRVRRRQRGFSLMEILVAMLVLAIGLLGLAALQTQGLRFNTGAYVRSQATTLAYDVIDKMRARRDTFSYTAVPPVPNPYVTTNLVPLFNGTQGDCVPTGVTVLEELTCWVEALELALPGARATIAQNAGNVSYVDVALSWVDREPRVFSVDAVPRTPRLANNRNECLFPDGNAAAPPFGGRSWFNNQCFITQAWTVYP